MSESELGAARTAPTRVLFVCTHNSARSIMAEALLRARGGSRFVSFSAGTESSRVRPMTLAVLQEAGISTAGLSSKSVAELLGQPFDYVVTVCDEAREACPTFPGGGTLLHWSYPDPSVVEGSEAVRLDAFRRTLVAVDARIAEFISGDVAS